MRALLGLGSNLGSREALLRAAARMLASTPGVTLRAASPVWETLPLGPAQPCYLNAALDLDTALSPAGLLDLTRGVERDLGRVRRARWGPRTLDLDLLWCAHPRMSSSDLTIPHAGLTERTFALDPLLALAPALCDPEGVAYADHRARLGPSDAAPRPWRGRGWHHDPNGALRVEALDRADGWAALAEALDALHLDGPPPDAPVAAYTLQRALPPDEGAAMACWIEAVAARLDAAEASLVWAVITADEGDHVAATLWCVPGRSRRREGWSARVARGAPTSAWPWIARVDGQPRG